MISRCGNDAVVVTNAIDAPIVPQEQAQPTPDPVVPQAPVYPREELGAVISVENANTAAQQQLERVRQAAFELRQEVDALEQASVCQRVAYLQSMAQGASQQGLTGDVFVTQSLARLSGEIDRIRASKVGSTYLSGNAEDIENARAILGDTEAVLLVLDAVTSGQPIPQCPDIELSTLQVLSLNLIQGVQLSSQLSVEGQNRQLYQQQLEQQQQPLATQQPAQPVSMEGVQ
jgi:hypothetical protein